jgi:hypothetical protein
MALPAMSLLALLCHALGATYAGGSIVALLLISFILPSYEWKSFRKVGQLWYELLDFRTNLSPERIAEIVHSGDSAQFIAGMHPHGIIPFHAMLYAAFCDQYLTSGGRSLYGFGAGANVVLYLPLLKHIMSWLSVTGADYESLRDRLADYKAHSNSRHSSAKHLFILPGGIAEVLVSAPKTHIVVFKRRRGLIKLALETGAHLAPIYVFGGTDFFHNLISGDNFVGRVSRRLRMGISVFYGPWFLPVPYTPRITFCYAEVVCVEKWDLSKGPIPEELIDELHCKVRYINAFICLTDLLTMR